MTADRSSSAAGYVREARLRLGLSQAGFARLLDVSVMSVNRWERGHTHPSPALLDEIERLGVAGPATDRESATQPREQHAPPARPGVGNLVPVPDELVGRGAELAELTRLLRRERLVTIVGTGGCGKTRLGLALADRVAPDFAGGVTAVDLTATVSSDDVTTAVATAVAVPVQPEGSLLRRLIGNFAPAPALLLLDNCEHLRPGVAVLVDALLAGAPSLRIVATSREPIGVPLELAWPAPPLSQPPAGLRPRRGETVTANTRRYEAVQLFERRAAAVQPGFALNDENAAIVAEICRRLDGLPLAIELAAARCQVLSVRQIAERLDDSLRLLGGGNAPAPPRHRSLAAALDWSFSLLDSAEQQLFTRLGLFAAGFDVDAVEAVATGDARSLSPLDLLSRLVARSLVVVNYHAEGVARYRLLDTVRAFARERLAQRGEVEAAAEQFTSYYLALALQAEEGLRGGEQDAWLRRLDFEWPNLRAALGFLQAAHPDGRLSSLAGALWRFWYLRGYLGEGRRWLEGALTASTAATGVVRAKALNAAAWLAKEQRDFAAARSRLEEAVAIWAAAGDRPGLATAYSNLGSVAFEQDDLATARAFYDQSLGIYRELADRRNVAIVLNNVGQTFPPEEQAFAVPLYKESLAICRGLSERLGMVPALNNLGLAAFLSRDFDAARQWYAEGLAVCRVLQYRYGEALLLANLGHVALAEGDSTTARARQLESLRSMREIGHTAGVVHALRSLAAADASAGDPAGAARLLAAVEVLAGETPVPVPPAYRAEHTAAELAVRQGLSAEELARYRGEGEALTLDQLVVRLTETAPVDPGPAVAQATVTPTGAGVHEAAPSPELSRREREVLRLLIAGRSNRQIAQALVLSVRTVEHHVAAIYGKLGSRNRAEAVARALDLDPGLRS